MLDASQTEYERLLRQSERLAEPVREMCARARLGEGTRVVDVRCGPIHAVAVAAVP